MLEKIVWLFWNTQQRRLRAFWRLVLQTTLFLVPIFVIAIFLGIIVAVFSVPLDQILQSNEWATLASMVLGAISAMVSILLAGWLLDRRTFADFGVHLGKDWWIDFGFGLALGAGMMGLVFLIEWGAGWITITGFFAPSPSLRAIPFTGQLFLAWLGFICVGIYEEFLSRGYHLKNMAEGFCFIGARGAVAVATLLSSVVFGLLHALNPNATFICSFNLFLAGVSLAMGYILTGELAIPIGLHITWNFFQGNVFGFPVSGVDAGARLIEIEQGGDKLITGGSFGPEGGLIGVGMMVLTCILIALWVRLRYGRVALHAGLASPDLRHTRRQ